MNRYPNSSKAERFGRWLGKNCRRAVNQERRLWKWLRAKHVPTVIVFLLSWSVRLGCIDRGTCSFGSGISCFFSAV